MSPGEAEGAQRLEYILGFGVGLSGPEHVRVTGREIGREYGPH